MQRAGSPGRGDESGDGALWAASFLRFLGSDGRPRPGWSRSGGPSALSHLASRRHYEQSPSLRSVVVQRTYCTVIPVKTHPQVVSSSSVILLSELPSYRFTWTRNSIHTSTSVRDKVKVEIHFSSQESPRIVSEAGVATMLCHMLPFPGASSSGATSSPVTTHDRRAGIGPSHPHS